MLEMLRRLVLTAVRQLVDHLVTSYNVTDEDEEKVRVKMGRGVVRGDWGGGGRSDAGNAAATRADGRATTCGQLLVLNNVTDEDAAKVNLR